MTFLPIVDRELRVAARKPSTYWLRFFAVLAGLAIWGVLLLGGHRSQPSALGRFLFNALSILAFGFTALAGVFVTADCVSEEKREGTLGLLFLTNLRGHDVLFGKLAATSIHTFYSLFAIFPVLALPLLLGGVTGGEFWRVVLALLVTLIFSLSVGLMVSTVCHDARPAMTGTLLVVLGFIGLWPLVIWALSVALKTKLDFLYWPCPAYAFSLAYDSSYRFGQGKTGFWSSLLTLILFSSGLIGTASRLLPRIWSDKGQQRNENRYGFWQRLRFGTPSVRQKIRSVFLEQNPFLWLTSRDRMPLIASQTVLLPLSLGWFALLIAAIVLPETGKPGMSTKEFCFILCIYGAFPLHQIFKIFVAIEASRRLNDDRQSGALELLLVTPLQQKQMLQGQLKALWRHFGFGLLLMALLNLSLLYSVFVFSKEIGMDQDEVMGLFVGVLLGGIVTLLLDFCAICYVGMASALRAKKYHRAVLGTVTKVLLIPWVSVFLLGFVLALGSTRMGTIQTGLAVWFLFGIILDLCLIGRAKIALAEDWRKRVLEL